MSSESQSALAGSEDPHMGRLTVSAVARRLGVAPGTLRTWDRRYGLGPSGHCLGAHRKYSAADFARLRYMHKLVISGVTPVEAAGMAIAHQGNFEEESGVNKTDSLCAVDTELVKQLFKAARSLDRRTLETVMRSQIVQHGVEATWVNLLVPLLCVIGDEWERTGESIASEHMITDVVKKVLTEQIVVAHPKNEVPILLACVGEESHSLAITALAAALAQVGIQVQFLGARTPSNAINEVVRRSAPAAIFLWAQLPENASFEIVKGLPIVRPTPRVILGGPGWATFAHQGSYEGSYEGAYVVSDLSSARQEIMNALGL